MACHTYQALTEFHPGCIIWEKFPLMKIYGIIPYILNTNSGDWGSGISILK